MLPAPKRMLELPEMDATASLWLFKSHMPPFRLIELLSSMISSANEAKVPPSRVMVPVPASRFVTWIVLVSAFRKMSPLPVLVAFKLPVLRIEMGWLAVPKVAPVKFNAAVFTMVPEDEDVREPWALMEIMPPD